jgi:hypothetical protein
MWLFKVLGCSRKSGVTIKAEEVPTVESPELPEVSVLNDSNVTDVPELEVTLESEKENTNMTDMSLLLEEYLKPYLAKANLSSIHVTPSEEYEFKLNKEKFRVPAKDFLLAMHESIRDNANKKPKYYGDHLIMFKSRKVFSGFKKERKFESEMLLNYINVIYEKC